MQLYLSISGIVLSAIIIYYNEKRSRSTFFLGGFFLFAGLYGLTLHVLFSQKSVELLAMLLANSAVLPYLVGPLLYFYIRSVLNDNSSLKKYDLFHLLPVLTFLAIASPYFLSPWSSKIKTAESFLQMLQYGDTLNTAFLGSKLLVFSVFIVPAFLTLGYVLWSTFLFYRFSRQNKEQAVFLKLQSTLKWIKAFLGIEILLVTGHLIFMVKIFGIGDLRGFASLNTLQFILGIGPMAILILTFFSPGILYGLPRVPENRVESIPEEISGNDSAKGKNNQKKLESGYLQSIGNEAHACMEKLQPYTNPGFNLAELSVLIHIPEHHLAYYFREVKKQTFTDYRNEWRVKHAKNLIKEGKAVEMTMESIGILAGFPNRDSFRAAFHRIEGVSPVSYISRKQD